MTNAALDGPNTNDTQVTPDLEVIRRWLEVVYAPMPGQLVISGDHDGWTGHFHPTDQDGRDTAAHYLAQVAPHANVYLRATTVHDDVTTGRGAAEDTAAVPGLWLDLDVAGPNHKRDNLPPTMGDALQLLEGMPDPTLHITSGGGAYIWWLFTDPYETGRPDDYDHAAELEQTLNQIVIARAKTRGWHVDNVSDLSRVLRAPGTLNHKNSPPHLVAVTAHSGVRYTPGELSAALQPHRPAAPVVSLPTRPATSTPASPLAEDIKQRWTAAQELQLRGHAAGRDRKLSCPIPGHADHNPSFHLYDDPDKGWACFGASCPSNRGGTAGGGSVIDLVMWLDDTSLDEALSTLAPRIGRTPPDTSYILPRQVPAPVPPPAEPSDTQTGDNLPYTPGDPALNDLGNGQRFAAAHAHHARYVYPWQAWIVWDGRRWQRQTSGRIDQLAKQTVDTILLEALQVDPDRRKPFLKWHVQSGNVSRMRNLLEAARSLCEADIDLLDNRPWELNTPNGIVDLRSGSILTHDPDRYHTKITGTPLADRPGPVWTRFLEQVLPDPELRGFVQRLAGAAACGAIRDHILPIHYGTGANGKSTFVDAVTKALGDYARPISVQVLMDGKRNPDAPAPEIAGLRGTRLAVAQEPELGERLRESTVKHITGGDRIVARRLYQDPFEFEPSHSLWLVTNHKPVIRGTDDGIWRRIALVPWTVTIPLEQRDPDLPRKLEDELDGILAWILQGAIAWATGGLQPPAQVTDATAGYRSEADRLAPWIEDRCVLSNEAREEPAALYSDYEDWCHKAADEPVAKHSFYLMLTERGFESGKSNGKRVRKGIALSTGQGRPGTPIQQNFIEKSGGEDQ